MDWGQCPRVTPLARSPASRSGPKVPGQHVGQERRGVDVDDARQPAHVEGHATEGGDARAAHARAPRHGRDRDPAVVTGGQDAGHLGASCRDGTPPRAGPGRHRGWPSGWPAATSRGRPRCGPRRRSRPRAHTDRSRASSASSTGTRGPPSRSVTSAGVGVDGSDRGR